MKTLVMVMLMSNPLQAMDIDKEIKKADAVYEELVESMSKKKEASESDVEVKLIPKPRRDDGDRSTEEKEDS